jgi:DNA repair exonuclease SbcCD ATPase subunit
MAAAKVEIIYEAEASSLKATVNEVIKANDAIVTDTKETTKEVGDEYKKIGAAAAAAFGGTQVKAALDQLNKESDKLTANLKELQKEQILLVGSGNKLTKSYQDNIKAQAALKSQISQVNQEQAELNRTFGQTEEKQKTLTGQLRGLKQELALLEEQGKDNSEEFNKLLFAAAKLEDQIGDTRERVRVLASDTFKFDAAVGATQALASGFEVAQGAAALFGSEGKELQEVIAKTTAVTAIANGVNELANQITGQGPLKLALYAAGQKAVAVATAISTGAISAFRVALAATGIGLFITGVALLVTKLQDAAANQASLNRSLELSKAAAENSKKAIEELRNAQLDSATRTLIATGQLSQAEADRLETIKGTRKQVDESIKVELAAQTKLIVEKQKLEQRLAVFKDAVDGDVIRKQRKNIQDQIDNQETEIKKSQENVRQIRQAGLLSEAQFNQALRSEESAKDRDEAQKLADDRKKAAEDAAKSELEARNAAREKLRQLELEALASQLDEREKILSDSNTKIAELEATFAEAKFAKGSEQEQQLQTSINLIKEQAAKDIAAIDQKALEDKAAKEKEAAEKAQQEAEKAAEERSKLTIAGLDAQINAIKTLEITEGTSLERRIQLIELDSQKRLELAKDNASEIKLINAETEQAIREERKKSRDEAIDQAFEIASASADALGSILKFQSQLTENRIAEIQSSSEKELEAINSSLESEVVKANKREALEKRTQSKIAAEKQKQARQEKALNIFRATIDTAASIVKTGAQLGYPAALPFQILAGIVGAANIAAIAAQPLPKFKKGGMVGGRSHEAGGTLIEAERGEYVVNKNSVMRNRRELDAINTSSAAFKRLIDERYVRPAILNYAMNNKRDGITVNASLNSKSMEKELKGLRKDMRNKNTIVNINGSDSRYTWQ